MKDKKLMYIINDFRDYIENVHGETKYDEYSMRSLCEAIIDMLDNLADYLEEK